jgi:hypothetical protein
MAAKIDRFAVADSDRPVRYRAPVPKAKLTCAAALTVGLAAAGCGSGGHSSTASQTSFKSGFAVSQRIFRSFGTDIARDITGAGNKTDAQLATEFRALADRAGQQATQLAALQPPAKYKRLIATLVAGFHATKADLSLIATAATHNDAASAAGATRTLLRDAARIKAVDVSLSRALGLPAPGAAERSRRSTTSARSTTSTSSHT